MGDISQKFLKEMRENYSESNNKIHKETLEEPHKIRVGLEY
jgi:hypothetical protein